MTERVLTKGLRILLGVTLAALVADLAITGMVAGGALDPSRYSAGGDEDRPLVVASTTVIDDLVLQLAGDLVRRELIVGPGGDPHVYEPTPRDQVVIEESALVILNGFGLEAKLERMVDSVRKPHQVVIDAADGLDPFYESGGHQVPDPHMWLSVPRYKTYVDNVQKALAQIDPANAHLYEANALAYLSELDVIDAHVRDVIGTIPHENRKLVTTHDAFRYYGDEYGIVVVDTVWGVTTDEEPTPEDLRQMVETLRAEKVPAVFIESSVNPKLLEAAAAEAGVRIGGSLFSDSLGLPSSGAHTYNAMMIANARTLAAALGGNADG